MKFICRQHGRLLNAFCTACAVAMRRNRHESIEAYAIAYECKQRELVEALDRATALEAKAIEAERLLKILEAHHG